MKITVPTAVTEEFVVIRAHVVRKSQTVVEKSRVKVSDARKCHSFPPACFLISRVVSQKLHITVKRHPCINKWISST